ncbi:acyl-CoA dehydrogenase C-terminal domain-containing protein [Pseudomonas sp. ZM23]|uniref:Acyl-CoA dehydrogenase C-terminal domain-containing protein n=1 Tax=Pseudomonas triclosanedens TaxID=2961893 RepID=A0ABY6ZZM5_9PSED|nr:acyl-CoA dehydrogenase C-terminal domain-containing protein [Pseudomonas triclosanedens]MCP8466777.1 acyl-CoA dehydrogenase C-terminal domain-containing protein [Pseudomonas triclosanedens]MCP8470001.1 acyl-CoA dehydrogenase C-terminal domain-containing protein [Pseudomonas triclosanedens]MCP8477911.1 acyl-CoA dehydrogenase C-terminal domain-containing protein [Pseudomonas triclosanedens]WAI49329.1 acyl-CoA dehydrogenase C-terminal domain-containing protein [Pseudomonas triclosanedens]
MSYQAPLRDMRFVLHELFDVSAHCEQLGNGLDRELIDGVLEEGARYTGEVVAPLNRNSDEQGATLQDGEVTTPDGFREAYRQYCDNGWASMTGPTEFGGQGFPQMVAACFHEMLMAASLSFRVYSGLTEGAVLALYKHGAPELQRDYLAKMVSGVWAGTMCLTEPQAGTDLALLRTRAEPQADGSYSVSGSKIFISGGEQDLSENIVHLVLARLPDAPAGVKGISLFLVPKFIANPDGTLGARNALSCGAIEHKMGIKGASTCVMNFDGATGWLIGQANQGLACMFTMMNDARFQVGLQGLGIAERSFQGALAYARERLQSRALSGPAEPSKAADPIIVHPDVRRMLLTQKTLTEGSRMLAALCARELDLEHGHSDADARKAAGKRAALLIPFVKSFLTDMGQEVASLGVQVYGGHGFIREWGMEQLMRDSRITQIYEGTNGIQALDLVRRKLLGDGGAELNALIGELAAVCEVAGARPELAALSETVRQRLLEWRSLTAEVIAACQRDVQEIGATSVDFLQYSSYVLLAGLWVRAAGVAQAKLAAGEGDADFYRAKLASADFYVRRILPRASMHREALLGGASCLMALDAEHFAF